MSLQELKAEQGAFPVKALRTLGYEAVWQGERSWNGVAILARNHVPVVTRTSLPGNSDGIFARGSRDPFDKLRASSERSRSSGEAKDLPLRRGVPREIPRPAGKKRGLFGMTPGNSEGRNHQDQQARYIEAAVRGVLITSIYLPNGNPQPGPKFNYKLAWLERLIAHAAELMASGAPVVLAGDYNVVPTPQDIYPTRSLDHNALIQPESRQAFARLLAQGWTDAMRKLHPDGPLWTFWDYKFERWQKDKGMRLDHFLLSPNLSDRLVDGGVDRWARGQENASDHAPTWITLDL